MLHGIVSRVHFVEYVDAPQYWHLHSPTAKETMYAQLLFVALALFAVANAATCSCSSCKGVTTKSCKVCGACVAIEPS